MIRHEVLQGWQLVPHAQQQPVKADYSHQKCGAILSTPPIKVWVKTELLHSKQTCEARAKEAALTAIKFCLELAAP